MAASEVDLKGLAAHHVHDFVKGDYAYWFATDSGINRAQIQNGKLYDITFRKTSRPVLSIEENGSSLLVGIASKGLYIFNKKTYLFKGLHKKVLRHKSITSIETFQGKFYLETEKGEHFSLDMRDSALKKLDVAPKINVKENKENKSFALKNGKIYQVKKEPLAVSDNPKVEGIEDGQSITNAGKDDLDSVGRPVAEFDTKEEALVNDSQVLTQMKAIERDAATVANHGEVKEKTCSTTQSFSAAFWYGFSCMFLIALISVYLLRRKMTRDINILEEELLKRIKED